MQFEDLSRPTDEMKMYFFVLDENELICTKGSFGTNTNYALLIEKIKT